MRDNTSRINSDEIRGRIRGYQPRTFSDINVRKRPVATTSRPVSDIKTPVNKSVEYKQTYIHQPRPQEIVQSSSLPKRVALVESNKQNSKSLKKQGPKILEEDSKNKSSKLVNSLLLAMAVFVFLIGAFASLYSLKVDKQITETVAAQAVNPDSDVSEDKPSDEDVNSYSVSPEMPKHIKIPKLDVVARIQQTGLKPNGQLDVPKNIYDTAWYKDSALPGSPGGASIIDGHVSGPTQKGVFYKLGHLTEGDSIMVEKGSGEIVNYTVKKVEVQDVNNVNMANMLVPITPGSHGLNLISCTGKYNSDKKDFEQRVLVFAEKSN